MLMHVSLLPSWCVDGILKTSNTRSRQRKETTEDPQLEFDCLGPLPVLILLLLLHIKLSSVTEFYHLVILTNDSLNEPYESQN